MATQRLAGRDRRVLVGGQLVAALRAEELEHRILDAARETRELLDDREAAERHVGRRVPALVLDDEPALAEPVGGAHDQRRQLAIAVGVHLHAAERIHRAGVEAVRDDDEVGPEALERRDHDAFEGGDVGTTAAAARERDVDVGAGPGALAVVLDGTREEREAAVLVERDREHAGIVVERALGAVAVVDVPVHDRHAREPARLAEVVRGDRDVAEEAEAHALARERVMAGRAHERVDVVGVAVEHGVAGRHDAARREQRDLVGARAERREAAGIAAVVVRQRLDVVDVAALVEAADLLDRGHARVDRAQLRRHARGVHQVLEAAFRERVLGMRVRLDPAARGKRGGCVPRVVPHVALVPDQSGRHRRLPHRSASAQDPASAQRAQSVERRMRAQTRRPRAGHALTP